MDAMTWLRAQWDRVAGFGLIGLGGLALLLGFRGVSNSVYVADQLSYIISGGLGGLYLLGAGAVLLIVAELRDEWRKLDTIEALLRDERGQPAADEPPSGGSSAAPPMQNGGSDRPRLQTGRRSRRAQRSAELPQHFAAATVTALLGALAALAISFVAVRNEVDPDPALRSTSWAIAALVAAGTTVAGSTLWAERRVKLRQSRIFAPLTLRHALTLAERAPADMVIARLVIAPGLTRYHRAGCPAVAGLLVEEIDAPDVPSGLEPCGLCLDV